MAKSYGDDLRRKLVHAHGRGEATLEQLSVRFEVGVPWAWKISAQRKSGGQMERIEQQRGNRPTVTSDVHQRLRNSIEEQPGLTLAELLETLEKAVPLHVSIGRL